MTTLHARETDRWRWRREDGARLILTTQGRLLESASCSGYQCVRERCGYEEALVYASLHGYRQATGSVQETGDAATPIRHVPAEVEGRGPIPDSLAPQVEHMPEAMQAERRSRIRDLSARVQADQERLGAAAGTCDSRRRCPCGTPLRSGQWPHAVCAACLRGDPDPLEGLTMTETESRVRLLLDAVPHLTYAQAQNHLREDGLHLSREQYEAARAALSPTEAELHTRERGPAADTEEAEDMRRGVIDYRRTRDLRAPATPPTPEEPVTMSATQTPEANGHAEAPRLNRFQAAARMREVLFPLGPAARLPEVNAALAEHGLPPTTSSSLDRAKTILWPDRAKQRPAPKPGRPAPRPQPHPDAPPRSEPSARDYAALGYFPPQPSPGPAAAPPADALHLVLLDRAVRRVGGLAEARRLLDLLAGLEGA